METGFNAQRIEQTLRRIRIVDKRPQNGNDGDRSYQRSKIHRTENTDAFNIFSDEQRQRKCERVLIHDNHERKVNRISQRFIKRRIGKQPFIVFKTGKKCRFRLQHIEIHKTEAEG